MQPTAAGRFCRYYTYGSGIALALDLSLRELSGGKQSLDDYMRRSGPSTANPAARLPALSASRIR